MRLVFALAALFPLICSAMSEKEKAVDAVFAEFAKPGSPGAAVMVIKDGKPILAKAYGFADVEKNIPCTTNTNFRLASVTKQFTAMAILILSERGKLSLDDSITRFFPEFPAYGKEIIVRHLLTHTSGVPDYEDFIPPGTTIPLSDRDVLHILRQQRSLNFPVGKEFRYSNSGYALLALIVEAASGQKFSAFLRDAIFQPLGMTNSVAYEAGMAIIPNRAFGYTKDESGRWQFKDQSLTSAVLGDGGIYSSVVDLFKWDEALYGEKLVSRKTLELAFTAHARKSDFDDTGYGFGWYVGLASNTKHVWHYGSTCGFMSKIDRYPEKHLTIIVLSNLADGQVSIARDKVSELFQ